jgi:hypothetical protein
MQHSSITTSGDTGQSNLPEEATMFEQLFTQSATIAHHHSSPYATERRQYLSHLMEEGRSRNSLRIIAELLMSYARHLPLHRADVCVSDIKVSAEAWAKTTSRSASCLRAGSDSSSFTRRSGCVSSDDYMSRKRSIPSLWNERLSFGFSDSNGVWHLSLLIITGGLSMNS